MDDARKNGGKGKGKRLGGGGSGGGLDAFDLEDRELNKPTVMNRDGGGGGGGGKGTRSRPGKGSRPAGPEPAAQEGGRTRRSVPFLKITSHMILAYIASKSAAFYSDLV